MLIKVLLLLEALLEVNATWRLTQFGTATRTRPLGNAQQIAASHWILLEQQIPQLGQRVYNGLTDRLNARRLQVECLQLGQRQCRQIEQTIAGEFKCLQIAESSKCLWLQFHYLIVLQKEMLQRGGQTIWHTLQQIVIEEKQFKQLQATQCIVLHVRNARVR